MIASPPGKRETKKRALRQAIFDTATRLFERDGYDAVSVGQITRELGIGKGTFFNHFETKADILADWYETRVAASLADTDPDTPLVERLFSLTHAASRVAADNPELLRAKNIESPRSPRLQAAERDIDTRLVARLREEIGREALPPHAPDAEALADLVLAIATGTWREAAVTGRPDMVGPVLRTRLQTLITAIGA